MHQKFSIKQPLLGGCLSTLTACAFALVLYQILVEIFQITPRPSYAAILYKAPAQALAFSLFSAPLTLLFARLLHHYPLQADTPATPEPTPEQKPPLKYPPEGKTEGKSRLNKGISPFYSWRHKICFAFCTGLLPIMPAFIIGQNTAIAIGVFYLTGGLLAGYYLLHRFLSKQQHHPLETFMGSCLTMIAAFAINAVIFFLLSSITGYSLRDLTRGPSIINTITMLDLIIAALATLFPFGLLAVWLDYLYFKFRKWSCSKSNN
ncbi:hypothetical protein [Kiloniella sp.]|uniref:hypothetical protein n=1 Tax=Kiloniella sp. TaxID=1938587 RepID=UPI003B02D24A